MKNFLVSKFNNKKVPFVFSFYFLSANLSSFLLFGYDKKQALVKQWRIPEKQLYLSALMGGWMGGILAMQVFRHKTVKQSFQIPYFLSAFGNCFVVFYLMKSKRVFKGFSKTFNKIK